MAIAVWLHATRQCFMPQRNDVWMLGTVSLCPCRNIVAVLGRYFMKIFKLFSISRA